MPSHLVYNEGVHNEGEGRDKQNPTPDDEGASTNNKIFFNLMAIRKFIINFFFSNYIFFMPTTINFNEFFCT